MRFIISAVVVLLAGTSVTFAIAAPKPPATAPAATAPANELTFTGKLSTGIMAIGGETTGTIISDGKATYELEIKDATLQKAADGLNGKQATVKGTLTIRQGIETGQRKIIVVSSIAAANP